jgi:hypothetical protein
MNLLNFSSFVDFTITFLILLKLKTIQEIAFTMKLKKGFEQEYKKYYLFCNFITPQ